MSSGWEVRMSNSKGVAYFYNHNTQESVWEPPAGLTQDEVNALPGASKYLSSAPTHSGLQPGQVRASHLLVKHRDSRRPSSWKEANITRTKAEAIEILKGYQREINGDPEKFKQLAKVNSDCSSARNGGDLGPFGKGQMQKPFEEATFALQVGEMSDIISTDSGVHLILRTA